MNLNDNRGKKIDGSKSGDFAQLEKLLGYTIVKRCLSGLLIWILNHKRLLFRDT